MTTEIDLFCYENMKSNHRNNAMVNAQALLRMWNSAEFLGAICMGLHARVGEASQLKVLGKEPQLLEDVCKMLRTMSMSKILSLYSSHWNIEIIQHSFFCGPLGEHVSQGSRGEIIRLASGGLVLQVFVGSMDGQLSWRADVRLEKIDVIMQDEVTCDSKKKVQNEVKQVRIPEEAMTVHTNAKIHQELSGSVNLSDTAMVLQGEDFKFVVYMLKNTEAMRTTLIDSDEFKSLLLDGNKRKFASEDNI